MVIVTYTDKFITQSSDFTKVAVRIRIAHFPENLNPDSNFMESDPANIKVNADSSGWIHNT